MNETDDSALVDGQCAAGLDQTDWEPLEVPDAADGQASSSKGKAAKGDPDLDAYITQQVQQLRPRSSADYNPRQPLPHPALQPVDSSLISDPRAWACAGLYVVYVAWHMIPLLVHFWKAKGFGGKPPCPRCWEHAVQVAADRQLTVGQCYEQLPPEQIKQLQDEGKLGKTLCHGWLRTPYRLVGVGAVELLMAFQYKCKGCPAASTSGRKATDSSYFMATDKGLLNIMQQQGLGAYVSMMQLQRGDRVGINSFLMKLIMHSAISTGTIKFFVDVLKELNVSRYLHQKLDYFRFMKLASLFPPKQQGRQLSISRFMTQLPGDAQAAPPVSGSAAAADGAAAAAAAAGGAAAAAAADSAAAAAAGGGAAAAADSMAAAADSGVGSSGVTPAPPAPKAPPASGTSSSGAAVKPFPSLESLPGATVSHSYLTRQLHAVEGDNRVYKRSLIDAAAAGTTFASVDFQHEPTKAVHTQAGRCFTSIFNMMCVKTGAIVFSLWSNSTSVEELIPILKQQRIRKDAAGHPPFKVIFVDDPRAFRKLKEVWPEAKLQQDAFHLTDRFSREVSPTNTLKAPLMQAITNAMLVANQDDLALVEAALKAEGKTLQEMPKDFRDSRVRRMAPDGPAMQAGVLKALKDFEGKVCVITGESPVSAAVWEVYNNQSKADIELDGKLFNTWDLTADVLSMDEIFVQKDGSAGVDKYGLRVYWRYRGSSYEEGMHGRHNRLWTGGHYGPEMAQIMTEGFFYSDAVRALRKAGQQTYGTQELWLLEEIKDAQAAVGAEVEYQGWTNVTILQEPLPPFGLERPLPTITEDTDASWSDEELDDMLREEAEKHTAFVKLANRRSLQWDVVKGGLQITGDLQWYCKDCDSRVAVSIANKVQVVCGNNHVLFDVEQEFLDAEASWFGSGSRGPGRDSAAPRASAATAAAAAAAAGGDSTGLERPAKQQRPMSAAEKVRRMHGQVSKTAGGNVSISRFFTSVESPQEQALFWHLYHRHTKGGSTQWDRMATVWSCIAAKQHQQGNFSLSYKSAQHLKAFHKDLVAALARGVSMASGTPAADPVAAAQQAALQAQAAADSAAAAAAAAAAAVTAGGGTDAPHRPGAAPLVLQGTAAASRAQQQGAAAGSKRGFGLMELGSNLLQAAGGLLGGAHGSSSAVAAAAAGSPSDSTHAAAATDSNIAAAAAAMAAQTGSSSRAAAGAAGVRGNTSEPAAAGAGAPSRAVVAAAGAAAAAAAGAAAGPSNKAAWGRLLRAPPGPQVPRAPPAGVDIGGVFKVHFEHGYPIKMIDCKGVPRKISECGGCGVPLQVPDTEAATKVLRPTTLHEHGPKCPRRTGEPKEKPKPKQKQKKK